MARYIDAEAFFETFGELNTEPYNNFPTADVVEVVRCEDCRYWENRFDVMVCNLTDGMKGASDYCSYGERREDEQIH